MPGIDSFSDEQLSRWIAEKLELKANAGNIGRAARAVIAGLDSWVIYPTTGLRDMIHAMTLLLQKQLIAQGKRLHYAAEDGKECLNVFDEHDWKLGREFIGPLERTTAEAFALANGWKPE